MKNHPITLAITMDDEARTIKRIVANVPSITPEDALEKATDFMDNAVNGNVRRVSVVSAKDFEENELEKLIEVYQKMAWTTDGEYKELSPAMVKQCSEILQKLIEKRIGKKIESYNTADLPF